VTPTSAEPHLESAQRWDRTWADAWPAIILASSVAVAIASLVEANPVVRAPLVLWFSLVCPGLAWVRLLHLGEPLVEAVAAIALSVALSGLTAGAFLYAGHWSPSWIMVALIAITVVGVAVDSPRLRGRLGTPSG